MPSPDTPPFRAEHVGSLLRPPALHQARTDAAAGRIDAAALRAVEDRAVTEAVALQEGLGFRAVTDGELRRDTWHFDFYKRIGGLRLGSGTAPVTFRDETGDVQFVVSNLELTGPLRLEQTIFADDFTFLKHATRATAKLTIPSPSVLHRRFASMLDGKTYKDMDGFWADLIRVYQQEIARLGAIGCTYLQIDDTSFATLCDPAQRAAMSRIGVDGEEVHRTYIRIFNECVKERPAGMTLATHTCRGNYKSAWFAAGAYDFIAEELFGQLDVDGFLLEYDDERSGGFAPLRFLPAGKKAVLGLVSTKHAALEGKDALKRRLDEAAKYVPLDRLCLSPQCGFSSTLEGNALTQEQQNAKLRLVAETAREVWG